MKALLLAAIVACTPAQRTTSLALASTTLLAVDWSQTRGGITSACRELNPIIGPCGDRVPVDMYFPVVIVAHLALGLAMREPWRDVWFGTVAGAQAATTWANWRTP